MKYKVGKPNYKSSFIYSALIIAWAIFLILFSPFQAMNIFGIILIFLIIFLINHLTHVHSMVRIN